MRYGKHWFAGFILLLPLVLCFVPPSPAVPDQEQEIKQNFEIFTNRRLSREDREAALARLVEIGQGQTAQEAAPAFLQALKDPKTSRAALSVLVKIGPAAIPVLIQALQDPPIGRSVGLALGQIGPAAIPALIKALEDDDAGIRSVVASALGQIGSAAVPDLIKAMKSENPWVRGGAAVAFGRMSPSPQEAIPYLIEALRDTDRQVIIFATLSLGAVGPAAQEAVPFIVTAYRNANPVEREMAARALLNIIQKSKDLSRVEIQKKISELENVRETIFKDFTDYPRKNYRDQLDFIINYFKDQQPSWYKELIKLLREDLRAWAVAGYVSLLLIILPTWLLILWLRPLWVYRLNELIPPASIKVPLIEWSVGLRQLLLLSPFHYCNRVLDAWVRNHQGQARASFAALKTVQDRAVYVPVPVTLNGLTVAQPSPPDFQGVFRQTPFCLLIWGEGGSGKTSLACQLADWALAISPAPLLARHPILPLLLEHDLKIDTASGWDPLLEAIRKQVMERLTAGREVTPDLLVHLLRRQRLLVIVDHYSELTPATREHIQPGFNPQLPLPAVIVTSRQEETFQGSVTDTVKPLRIQGNRLSSFLEAYLMRRGKRELYDDEAFFDVCKRLTAMVGDRNITVLLARLYADQMIAAKEEPSRHVLPDSIPDLMLSYLNWINRKSSDANPGNPAVQRIAKAISWECLKLTFRPTNASLAGVRGALATEPDFDRKLAYLCQDLGIIQCVGPAEDKVRLTLDPLAEYLAGLQLLEIFGDKNERWQAFLEEADKKEGAPKAIEGFLLAVRDCCLAKGKDYGVPGFVEHELAKKAGMNLESKSG